MRKEDSTPLLPATANLATGQRRVFLGQWLALTCALLFVGGLMANHLYNARRDIQAAASERLSQGAKSIAYSTERRLVSINTALTGLAENLPHLTEHADGTAHLGIFLKTFRDSVDGVRTVMIFDALGTVTAASREDLIGMNFQQREYFQTARNKPDAQTLYVPAPFQTTLGSISLNLNRATFDARGKFSGIVSATLDPEYFKPMLMTLRHTPDVSVGLIHGSGKVLLYVSSPDVPPGTDVSDPLSFFSRHLKSGKEFSEQTGFAPVLQGERLAAVQTINPVALSMSDPLVVVVSQELASILTPWHADVHHQLLMLAVLSSLTALALFLHQRRQRSLSVLGSKYQTERQNTLDRLRLVTEASGTGIWEYDIKSQVLSWDNTMLRLYGKECDGFSSALAVWQEYVLPEDLPDVEAKLQRSIDTACEFDTHFRIRRGDGEIRIIEALAWVYKDKADQPRRMIGVNRDITQRKLAEKALFNAQRLTQQFLDHLPGTAFIKDENLRVLMANKAFQTLLGLDPEAMLGKTNSELFPSHFARKLDDNDRCVLTSGQSTLIEEDFEGRFFETNKFVIEEDGKRLLGGITMEVTQRQKNIQRQQALLKVSEIGGTLPEEEFLKQGLELAEGLTLSQTGFIHFVNDDQQTIELATWTTGALKGCAAVHEKHYPIGDAGIWADCARKKEIAVFNDYLAYGAKKGLPEGHAPLYRLVSVPVVEEGKVRMILCVGNKPSAYDDFDCTTLQLIGNDLWRIAHRMRTEKALQNKVAELNAANARLDKTNNKLMQTEKLAALGQLAAGVAHEINNPIGYVSSNLNSLAQYVDDLLAIDAAYTDIETRFGSLMPNVFSRANQLKSEADHAFIVRDIQHLFGESREGLKRVSQIVQDLKNFSRVGTTGWQWVNIQEGLESTLNIVWNEIKYKAEVNRDYSELPEVYCIPSQINQVFMNLLTNAAQAITTRGHITLRTGCDASTVWVDVQDDGAGIAPEAIPHIFEPFYTTKPVGQGTGLGLSLSWSIIQRHQGKIEVRSEPGKGASFRVILPIDPQPLAPDPVEATS